MAVGCVMPDSRHRISAWEMGSAMGTLNISNWHFIAMLALVLCFLRCMLMLKNWLSIDSGCHDYQMCTVWGTCVGRRNGSSIEHIVVCSDEEQHVIQCMCSVRHWLRLRKQVSISYIMQFVWGWVSSIYFRVCSVWDTSLAWGNSSLSGISNDSC